jgi:hypothetical protein
MSHAVRYSNFRGGQNFRFMQNRYLRTLEIFDTLHLVMLKNVWFCSAIQNVLWTDFAVDDVSWTRILFDGL